jgi:predicted glutamine amidotransferase
MCRLFGFRSVTSSQVHRSLVSAENALAVQSRVHKDGWGVAWYHLGVPHLIKGADSAFQDRMFARVSGVVASRTVLAHIRQATVGDINVLNSHPFQYGRWVMAHNGTVFEFARHREALLNLIDPALRRSVLGDTDSEMLFMLVLTELGRLVALDAPVVSVPQVAGAIEAALNRVRAQCDESADRASRLTVLLTNGDTMVGACSGRELHWSTWKHVCQDKDVCAFHAPNCEAPSVDGKVNHLILSSEPLQGENDWTELPFGGVVGVDADMQLWRGRLGEGVTAVGRSG